MKLSVLCLAFTIGMITAEAPQAQAVPRFAPDSALDVDGRQAVEGVNCFSLDLYKSELSPRDDLFLSPASASIAMGFAYPGARGATAAQLKAVFHYPSAPEPYLATDAELLRSLNIVGGEDKLRAAEALWLQDDFKLNPLYQHDIIQYAAQAVRHADFKSEPSKARETINAWVAQETADKIKMLLGPEDVKKDTRAVLVSTLYWKGHWAKAFNRAESRPDLFTELNGRRALAPLMHQQGDFRAIQRGSVKLIDLPYASGLVSMIVLMPDDPAGLPSFEKTLDSTGLSRLIDDLELSPPRETRLTFPEMHLRWHGDLAPTLKSLGARTAFGDDADFTLLGMQPRLAGQAGDGLKLKSVIQETVLDVDEKTTEAAAATAIDGVVVTGARIGFSPFVFSADKPFMFLLRDSRTGLILFIGRHVRAFSSR